MIAPLAAALGAHRPRRRTGDPVVGIPETLARRTAVSRPADVFSAHRSETEMLRYLRRLADRDLALDRSMIPLGVAR